VIAALALALVQDASTRAPLPVGPPISGPLWTLVIPAILLLVSVAGTWALWDHFANKKEGK
jgi:hypothetical protein